MVEGLVARTVIGLFALFVLASLCGTCIVLGEARSKKGLKQVSKISFQFVALSILEIILIVVLALQ